MTKMQSGRRPAGKHRNLRTVAVLAVVLAVVGVVIVATVHLIYGRSWAQDGAFSARVADAVGQGVSRGVAEALDSAQADLSKISVGGKAITLDDLAHWHDLLLKGEHDLARQELRARFTAGELRQLASEMEGLMQRWTERADLTSADLKQMQEMTEQLAERPRDVQEKP